VQFDPPLNSDGDNEEWFLDGAGAFGRDALRQHKYSHDRYFIT